MPRNDLDELDAPPIPPQIPRMEGVKQRIVPLTPSDPPTQRVEPKEFDLRPGDSGEDRPTQVPRDLAPLSETDLKALAAEEERLLQKELREAEELIASDPSAVG